MTAQASSSNADHRHSLAEDLLGYRFSRPELLREALTHRSAAQGRAKKRGQGSNERLEFLGDRVLGLLIAEWLAERFPDEQEGALGPRRRSGPSSRMIDYERISPGMHHREGHLSFIQPIGKS